MSQAEHGPTSPAWLVTTCQKLAREVNTLVRVTLNLVILIIITMIMMITLNTIDNYY